MRDSLEVVFRDLLVPLIEADGGTIELVDVREGLVTVRLGGAYRGCPSSGYTLSRFIEPAVQKAMGRATKVELVI